MLHSADEEYPYALNTEEKQSRGKGKSVRNKGDNASIRGRESSKSAKNEEPEEGQEVKPDSRGRKGFRGKGRGQTFGYQNPLKCFRCGEAHKVVDCPQNPKRTLVAQEEAAAQEVEAETGEILILQRSLISRNKEILEDDWKRKSVFLTRCKCKQGMEGDRRWRIYRQSNKYRNGTKLQLA